METGELTLECPNFHSSLEGVNGTEEDFKVSALQSTDTKQMKNILFPGGQNWVCMIGKKLRTTVIGGCVIPQLGPVFPGFSCQGLRGIFSPSCLSQFLTWLSYTS